MDTRVRFLEEKCAEIPDQPYQPTEFNFPRRSFGKRSKLTALFRALGLGSGSGCTMMLLKTLHTA